MGLPSDIAPSLFANQNVDVEILPIGPHGFRKSSFYDHLGGSVVNQLMARVRHLLFKKDSDWLGVKLKVFLLEHPNISLAFVYITISGLGLISDFLLFREFDVNIFEYSEISDFVGSAVKLRPDTIFASLFTIAFFVIMRLITNWIMKLNWRSLRIFLLFFTWPGLIRKEIYIVLIIFVFWELYSGAARIKAHDKVYFEETIMKITTKSGYPKTIDIIPIGSIGSFIFGIEYSERIKEARTSRDILSTKVVPIAVHTSDIAGIKYSEIAVKKIALRAELLTTLESSKRALGD